MSKQAQETSEPGGSAEEQIAEGLKPKAAGGLPETTSKAVGVGVETKAQGQQAGDAADAAGRFVTQADLEKMLDARVQQALQQHDKTRLAGDVRERFIREKMGDLPLVVQNLLPQVGDVKVLAGAEQDIRKEMSAWFQAGLKRYGLKIPDVNGGAGTHGSISPMQMGIDTSKISPEKLIAMGIEQGGSGRKP
jgi:hypothetical protein